MDHSRRDGWKKYPAFLRPLKTSPVNFLWPYLLRDTSVWFNVQLTVIGFWCLPLITSANWGGQFILWMHMKQHQKLRSWRPGNIIKAFCNATLCVIGDALSPSVCVRTIAGLLKFISIFFQYSHFRMTDWHFFFLATASSTHSVDPGQFASEWWKCSIFYLFSFVFFFFFTPLLIPQSLPLSSWSFHDKQPGSNKCSLTHILARLIKKIFKIGLTVEKLSQMVQRIWSGRREDWCFCCKPLSRTGPGSNQRATTHPHSAPPLLPHSHRIFSHYSEADRWASLCISAMHFLKSEKPIHLGQKHKEEGVRVEGGGLQNSFFSLLPSTQMSFTASLNTLSPLH